MGGLYGINRFRPDDIKYNKKRPSVMFTRLFLFNEEVGVGEEYEGRVILDKALNKVDQIKFEFMNRICSVYNLLLITIFCRKKRSMLITGRFQ